jgi:hypothetical protein
VSCACRVLDHVIGHHVDITGAQPCSRHDVIRDATVDVSRHNANCDTVTTTRCSATVNTGLHTYVCGAVIPTGQHDSRCDALATPCRHGVLTTSCLLDTKRHAVRCRLTVHTS